MDFVGILIACLVVGGTGLVIGLLLGFAGKTFEVKVDERVAAVREALPSNNCGACGYAGCDACAEAIVAEHLLRELELNVMEPVIRLKIDSNIMEVMIAMKQLCQQVEELSNVLMDVLD